MAPHGKELELLLHKDGLGYKKFGNSLKLSYSSDQGHIEVFQDGFPSEQTPHGAIKEVESLYCASGAEAGFKKQRMSAASIALEVAEVKGQLVSAQTYTTHNNKSVCMAIIPEGSLFWGWLTKKPANRLLKTTWPRAWITGTMSCGLMSLRETCLTPMVSSMCGDALVRSTNKIVPCLQWSMVVVASWSGAAWLLLVLGSCGSLRETLIPTCTVTFWSRRWCPPFKLFSNITSPNTPPRWQLPCYWRWR